MCARVGRFIRDVFRTIAGRVRQIRLLLPICMPSTFLMHNLAPEVLQTGRNPAKFILEITKVTGFAPKPKEQPAIPAETEHEKLARIAKGQEAGFSPSRAGGSKAPNSKGIDGKSLANTSDDDLSAFFNNVKERPTCADWRVTDYSKSTRIGVSSMMPWRSLSVKTSSSERNKRILSIVIESEVVELIS
jgi:hypothetical protein